MTTTPMARPLAQDLLRTRGQGIAAYVQERVHSTSVSVAAATQFVHQLVCELESAVQILARATENASALQLSDAQELELGTLISASSLTIRYVTEREAITPELGRFSAAFHVVLRFPLYTKALLGLKMVSLMGKTRLLESFGDHVAADAVVDDLRWLFSLFDQSQQSTDTDYAMRVNYLFRPACEQLTVAIQSHPAIHRVIFDETIPALVQLAPAFTQDISDAVATELLATIAVGFDLMLPSPSASAFSLLPMPTFARDEPSSDDADEDNIHILQRTDAERGVPAIVLPDDAVVTAFAHTLVAWLDMDGRRRGVLANVPHICAGMAVHQQTAARKQICDALLTSLESCDLHQAADFEWMFASVESVRDLGLRHAIPTGLEHGMLSVLKQVMPRLQTAPKSLDVEPTELRTIKATCSSIRDMLVQVFVWWIHYAAHIDGFHVLRNEFVTSVVDTLADPRIQGDLLHVSRASLDEPGLQNAVDAATRPLVRAVKQLDRYSKVAASRIVVGIARVAAGAGPSLVSVADSLAEPLLQSIVRGTSKGKALRQRLSAVACILVSCSKHDAFSLDEHEWVNQFIGTLLEASASRNVHSLAILDELVRDDPKIRVHVAHVCSSLQEMVGHLIDSSLSSWPIFAEDLDSVLLVLTIFNSLLGDEQLCASVDVPSLTATVIKLRENAQGDGELDLVEACDGVLATLAARP